MAPGGPLGPRGGNGRDSGGRVGATEAPAGAGGGALAARGAGGGALVGRAAGGGGAAAAGGSGGGAAVVRAGGRVERLPSDFAEECDATPARDDAGPAGATESVRTVRAMLGAARRASGVRYH